MPKDAPGRAYALSLRRRFVRVGTISPDWGRRCGPLQGMLGAPDERLDVVAFDVRRATGRHGHGDVVLAEGDGLRADRPTQPRAERRDPVRVGVRGDDEHLVAAPA